jgi:hypothetical protein
MLLRDLTSDAMEMRQYAADTARRLSEVRNGLQLLQPKAQTLIDMAATALTEGVDEAWRTRGHLMLVAARVAQTSAQRRRCADMLLASINDPRGVLRANALDGLGLLCKSELDLREVIEPVLLRALRSGTAAERVRARDALAALESP